MVISYEKYIAMCKLYQDGYYSVCLRCPSANLGKVELCPKCKCQRITSLELSDELNNGEIRVLTSTGLMTHAFRRRF